MSNFEVLPEELLYLIILYCNYESLQNLFLVSKKIYKISTSEDNIGNHIFSLEDLDCFDIKNRINKKSYKYPSYLSYIKTLRFNFLTEPELWFDFTKFFSRYDNINILIKNKNIVEFKKISTENTVKLLESYEKINFDEKIKLSIFEKPIKMKIINDSINFYDILESPIGIYKFKNPVVNLSFYFDFVLTLYVLFKPNFGSAEDVDFYFNRKKTACPLE